MDTKFISSGGFLGKTSETTQSKEDIRMLFDCGTLCLQGGRIGEAYVCYTRIGLADTAVWFNRALCLLSGGEYNEAYECLLRADAALHVTTPIRPPDRLQTKLDDVDAVGDGYLRPMSADMPQLFPNEALRQILRVMVDVAYLSERYNEVHRIAVRLKRHYKNVDTILELIKHH